MTKEPTVHATVPAPTTCPFVASLISTMPIIPRTTEMRAAEPSRTGRALIWNVTQQADDGDTDDDVGERVGRHG